MGKRIKGVHSATPKGTNGRSNPKASGQTTGEGNRYGKGGNSPAGGRASGKARIV